MPNEERSPNDKWRKGRLSELVSSGFELRHSFVIWHSSFVIHSFKTSTSPRSYRPDAGKRIGRRHPHKTRAGKGSAGRVTNAGRKGAAPDEAGPGHRMPSPGSRADTASPSIGWLRSLPLRPPPRPGKWFAGCKAHSLRAEPLPSPGPAHLRCRG